MGWPVVLPAMLGALVLILATLAVLTWSPPTSGQLQSDQPLSELVAGTTDGQTFVARYGRVSRVDVLLGTFARQNSGPLIFHLKRSPAAADDLATVRINTATVANNMFRAFEFAPVPNSMGEPLYFYLEAPEAAPGNALTVWGYTLDTYPDGQAIVSRDPHVPDLAFRVYYAPTFSQSMAILFNWLTFGKPGPFGVPAWYGGLGLVYFALLLWLGWEIAPRTPPGSL